MEYILSRIALTGKTYTVDTSAIEGLQAPYIILSNHMHFTDFELAAAGTYPRKVSNVVSFEGHVFRWFLIDWIGSITTRRFTFDLHLIKSIRKVLQRGDILCMYPEARYTPSGTASYIPDSVGKLIKMNKVPVVITKHHGNHLRAPFWDFRHKRKVPLHTVMKPVLTRQQIETMSASQISEVIRREMQYDDYRYQKKKGIRITEPFRAEGLHKLLYQCPHCGTEFEMGSQGAELFCNHCGKRWFWQEDGYLQALDGNTEFSHIPDWFEWEREQVRQQVERGEYCFTDEVDVYGLPRVWRFIHLGKGKLTHNPETGFTVEGVYRGKEYRLNRKPGQSCGLHIEYDYLAVKKRDCVVVSVENDSLFCCPTKPNQVTKLSLATDVIYQQYKMQKTKGAAQ
jgi:DNA-directed RNA polymerase subunit RPC12/RpoP